MMHPTWLHAARVQKHRWWRPLLWAGLLVLTLLLVWQAATSARLLAAVPIATAEPWRFMDESKPGAPTAKGEFITATAGSGTAAPTEIAARFRLSSTMQALTLQYHDAELAGLPLAQVEELRYCTRLVDGPRPYAVTLQLNVDADVNDGDHSWQGRLVYTPSYNGAVIQGEWQCWNTLVGKWWATGGPLAVYARGENPQPLGTLLAHFPNLGVSSDQGAVVLKAGDGWSDFQGEASPVVIGVEGEQVRLAFGAETEPDEILLPVLYQEPEQSAQDDEARKESQAREKKEQTDKDEKDGEKRDSEKRDKEKKDNDKANKENNEWSAAEWGDVNWDDFDWTDVDWDKVDWEHLDWSAFGWSSFGWNGNRGDRAEAVKAFVADVRACKNGSWEQMDFKNQGECVAYYAKEHTPSNLDWGRNWDDRNWRSHGDRR